MTVVTNIKAANVTLMDALNPPANRLTTGEGGPGYLRCVEDMISLPVTFFSATNNYARVLRIPTTARIKSLSFQTDVAVDSAATTGAAAFVAGVMFSDSTIDGTPVAYQGLVPSTVGIGGGTTTAGTTVALPSTANANALFGTITAPANTGAIPKTECAFGGVGATYGTFLAIGQVPLVQLFNFWNTDKSPIASAGFFDIFIMSSHAYTTVPSAAANFYARCDFVD